jgi:hypothetical protein
MSSVEQIEYPPGVGERVRDKWGVVSDPGFLTLPYVLLLHQIALGLSSENLNVLLNVIAHWHAKGRMPYPHSATIAKRMGASQRTVQRSLSWLCKNGFMAKVPKRRSSDTQAYDMEPLKEKLKPFALERIKLIQAKDYAHVLSDEYLHALSKQKTVEEMFGGVAKTSKSTADEL